MRIALHTKLLPGAEDAYDAAHREVPEELVAAIRAAGAGEWTIWRSGVDLFHVLDCDDYQSLLAALAPLPVNVSWQARMATCRPWSTTIPRRGPMPDCRWCGTWSRTSAPPVPRTTDDAAPPAGTADHPGGVPRVRGWMSRF